ncbi:hypothetical protein JW877_03585 [bacterium]|nr:hypothetical protein [bacterium]
MGQTLLLSEIQGQTLNWQVFTDLNYIQSMESQDSIIWTGTKGGIGKYHTGSGALNCFTNLDGLAGIDIVDLGFDGMERLWYATYEGIIGRLEGDRWINFLEFKQNNIQINKFVNTGMNIWIATNTGVTQFSIIEDFTVGEIVQNCSKLGDLPRESPVNDLVIFNDTIYAGMEAGIARAAIHDNLTQPDNWIIDRLEAEVKDLIVFRDSVYCLLQVVAGGYNGDAVFKRSSSGWVPAGLEDQPANEFFVHGDSLLALSDDGIFRKVPGLSWQRISFPHSWDRSNCAVQVQGKLWIGLSYGIARLIEGEWNIVNFPTILGSEYKHCFIDQQNRCWITSMRGNMPLPYGGISGFIDSEWSQYNTYTANLHGWNYICSEQDDHGNVWYGTWGTGIAVLTPDSTWIFLDTVNTPLAPSRVAASSGLRNYIVVPQIKKDAYGNMWVITYDSQSDSALFVWLKDSTDFGSGSVSRPIAFYFNDHNTTLMYSLMVRDRNRVWVGLQEDGLMILDYGSSISDNSDDLWIGYNDLDGQAFGEISAISIDKEGLIWIGTAAGLVFYDTVFGYFQPVSIPENLSSEITAIDVDNWNNKWFGTTNGAAILYANMDSFDVIKSTFSEDAYEGERQGLLSDIVNDIKVNPHTGDVWFVVNGGVCRFETGFSPYDQDIEIPIYPNPFHISYGSNNKVTFAQLPADAVLYIFTTAGDLVRYFPQGEVGYQALIEWDGTNKNGKLVAGGIYTIIVSSSIGIVRQNFAVIR